MVAERVLISICVYSLLKSTVSTFLGLLPIFFLSFFFFTSGIDWQSSVLRYFQIALKFACKYVTWWKLICTDDKEI